MGSVEHDDTLAASTAPVGGAMPSVVRGTTIGRFVLGEIVGSGGMGVVYQAFDPELDRKVAIKLLRRELGGSSGTDGQTRMMREAQAMARVSHPNVLAVYDVGLFGDDLFIAEELVEGGTLARWLKAEQRPWREVIARFRAAGEGLAAAHRAGLVHRDFKPENVLIGADGRPRVCDFGLARATGETTTDAQSPSKSPASDESSPLTASLTRSGDVLGTPLYMAPEQHAGGAVDARADQFSFCVALYAALFGEPPFRGDSRKDLAASIEAGRVRSPRAGSNVPAWVRSVVLRGLAAAPADRYESMDELLAALTHDPAVKRRRWMMGIGIATIAVVAVAGGWWLRARSADRCGAPRSVADVWTMANRAAITVAFARTAVPYAADSTAQVASLLDRWTGAHVAMQREVCEATYVRGEQSEELLDRRVACLVHRRREVAALVETLAKADKVVVEKAVAATRAATSLQECTELAGLAQRTAWSPPARDRERVETVRGELDRARAIGAAGLGPQALEIAQKALAEATALGFPVLEAETLLAVGVAQDRLGTFPEAAKTLSRAGGLATSAGQDDLIAQIWVELTGVLGKDSRFEEGYRIADIAAGAVDRVGGAPLLATRLALHRGQLANGSREPAEAIAEFTRARELAERLGPDRSELPSAISGLGVAYYRSGNYPKAVEAQREALAMREKQMGPTHPSLANTLINLANVLTDQGDHAQAIAAYERAIHLLEAAYGPQHPYVADSENNLGTVYLTTGDYRKALSHFERSLELRTAIHGPDHPETAQSYLNIGTARHYLDDNAAARTAVERALAIHVASVGPVHEMIAHDHYALGEIFSALGPRAEARKHFSASLEMLEKIVGLEHGNLAHPLSGLALVELEDGKASVAVALLERALRLREAAGQDPMLVASTKWLLAKALWAAGRDRARALDLARAAKPHSADWEPDSRAELEAFLAKNAR